LFGGFGSILDGAEGFLPSAEARFIGNQGGS
jgi:hypothetical protein